jgi:hypothetical protein
MADMRRHFALPTSDGAYLESTGAPWETIEEQAKRWLLIHGRELPPGYTIATAVVALEIPPGYPDAQIDMAYFHPILARSDGRPIAAADSRQAIDGQQFQRWSRHRTAENPWRPGEDDVANHLVLVDDWIVRELQRA